MQEQVVLEATRTRLTEEETSLIVALHAEREQRDHATTLEDLAETLHISLSDAQLLLTDVRSRLNPIPPAVHVEATAARPKRKFGRWIVACLVLTTLAYQAGLEVARSFPRFHGTGSSWASAPFPFSGSGSESMVGSTNLTVAVRTGALVTNVYPTGAWSSDLERSLHTSPDRRAQLGDTIFEALDFAVRGQPNTGDYISVGVQDSMGSWRVFDVPIDGTLTRAMGTIKSRDAVREAIHKAVLKEWPPAEHPPEVH